MNFGSGKRFDVDNIYRSTGFALVPAYTKTTSRVRLAYSGFRLRTALFFNPHVQVS